MQYFNSCPIDGRQRQQHYKKELARVSTLIKKAYLKAGMKAKPRDIKMNVNQIGFFIHEYRATRDTKEDRNKFIASLLGCCSVYLR
jgi:putative ubiquitin-RnfH superfamily antitoxin RatB of RatAB toxin-antitoxin module